MAVRAKTARVVASAAVVGLSLLPLTGAPANAAAGGNGALQFCRSISGDYPGNIIGPCTSYFVSHDSNAAATTAYFCRTFFVPEDYFATVGECVSSGGL